MANIDRRRFLATSVATIGGLTLVSSPVARAAGLFAGHREQLRVYVLVVDGLDAAEVTPLLMPRLSALRDTGVAYARASAINVAETLPNHVAMMTGVHADRGGVPGNNIYDEEEGQRRQVDRPDDITAETLFETLGSAGLTTASVLSKEYLWTIFDDPARFSQVSHWQAGPQIPVSEHAPDLFTMDETLRVLDAHDPDFAFISLGDVDRSGHSDPTGETLLPAFRTAVLTQTDQQIGRLVDHLVRDGRWSSTVLIVTADHSMDWSLPNRIVSLRSAYDSDPDVAGSYEIGQNGGAGLLYFTGDDADKRDHVVARMRDIARSMEGVAAVRPTADPELRLGGKAGDLAVFIEPGWRFTDPDAWSNPIPGNHGHLVTLDIPFLVTGGSELVRHGTIVRDAMASNLDIAPTVAALFRVDPPSGGYEGRVLGEAFNRPGTPGALPGPPPGRGRAT
jgi:ectonucleotide pyrophosphatase/phosphodiesterase family member 5